MSAPTSASGATAVAATRETPVTRVTPATILTGFVAAFVAAALVILPEVSGFEGPGFFVAAPVCVVILGLVVGIVAARRS